ncbi:hypothetical protein [Arcanobacterium phocae]|uniref:hypothetical protein n=1 Tax=Arcanobacterium phocae TaxID=131112 RepID=UPI001C0F156A|nr:hypothetical protein [Arcanobacterium phocae]
MAKRKKKNWTLLKPLAYLLSVLIILAIPLPFGLYLAGIEWIFSGSDGVPKEFTISYVLGLVILCGSLAIVIVKDRWKKK